jgi:molecular chaperone HtpG
MFRAKGKDAVILKHNIDSAFITQLERRNESLRFMSIDAELTEDFTGEDAIADDAKTSITETFRKVLNNETLEVRVENIQDDSISSTSSVKQNLSRLTVYASYKSTPDLSISRNPHTSSSSSTYPKAQLLGTSI